jgi:hypothetical protein
MAPLNVDDWAALKAAYPSNRTLNMAVAIVIGTVVVGAQ